MAIAMSSRRSATTVCQNLKGAASHISDNATIAKVAKCALYSALQYA